MSATDGIFASSVSAAWDVGAVVAAAAKGGYGSWAVTPFIIRSIIIIITIIVFGVVVAVVFTAAQ